MKKEEFREEIDAWIKSFKKDIDCFSGELDDYSHVARMNAEETKFNYENICRLENRLDKIEMMLEKIAGHIGESTMHEIREKIQE